MPSLLRATVLFGSLPSGVYYFAPYYLYYGKQNLPLKWNVSFYRCLPIAFTPTSAIVHVYECESCSLSNCSKFAVECDWNSKISRNVQKIWVFSKKVDEFFEKILLFFKIAEVSKFDIECVSNGIISRKCLFRKCPGNAFSHYEVFLAKIRKIWTLEKLENMMKKECSFREKSFHLLKTHLYQNGKAQIMPVVASRLVYSAYRMFPLVRPFSPACKKPFAAWYWNVHCGQ